MAQFAVSRKKRYYLLQEYTVPVSGNGCCCFPSDFRGPRLKGATTHLKGRNGLEEGRKEGRKLLPFLGGKGRSKTHRWEKG